MKKINLLKQGKMLTRYNHEQVNACRKSFLSGNEIAAGQISAAVFGSWQRCMNIGLAADKKPPVTAQIVQPDKMCWKLPRFLGGALFNEFSDYLEQMPAAYFILQEDGTVIIAGGNKELQTELDAININAATVFSESYIGTCAVTLCDEFNQESWVIGAEHYLESLQDYVTYASWSPNPFSRYIMLVFIKRTASQISSLAMFSYFRRLLQASTELYQANIMLAKNELLFEQLKNIQEEALILVDFSQKIICVNKHFEHLFEISQQDVEQHFLTEIFPELESLTACLATGKDIVLSEISFEGLPAKNKNMLVTCSPWNRNGLMNGMVISLLSGKTINPALPAILPESESGLFEQIIGDSELFAEIKNMAHSIATSNSSVILTGESGTGKDLFAKAIHNESLRRQKPFVAVNCSAIPKELIGSELFGYGDGAFTGARRGGAMGKFEYANGGTLFLDEVAELPLEVQAILLRVLEEHSVVRIGTNAIIPVDVRIISATNKNLVKLVKDNLFRLDLYYRLNVISIEIPPLRKRTGDIPALVEYYLKSIGTSLNKVITGVSSEVMDCFVNYFWPGNVRQLRNVLEYGINMASGKVLRLEDLPQEIRVRAELLENISPKQAAYSPPIDGLRNYEEWEREKIWELMQKHKANKSKIASELGISRGTLYKKIQRYGL